MADEEKKPEGTDAATPKEDPSPTVSHTEPAAVHSGQEVPPLAKEPETHDAHDHAHGHDPHAHDAHAHSASGADFGEVIPEKNWQDSFLAGIAALVLCGFLWVGVVWSKIPPPLEKEEHPAQAAPAPATAVPSAQPSLTPPSVTPETKQPNK